ncbi:MAG: hypothetical protein EXS03_05155 [Phycisphaerales bacterium]|nr:hypothetical protein [Phycisphaerales bacterium]
MTALLGPLLLCAVTTIDHVMVVSIDGLRPDLLRPPIVAELPGFARLMRGPHTLDARTDPDSTVTLPNHVGMATGRLFAGPHGHGWLGNIDPPKPEAGGTIAQMHGSYVASMFDVASDRGVATAVIASKSKFTLLDQSYSESAGAPDTIGADDGPDKIDEAVIREGEGAIAVEAIRFLRSAARSGGKSLSMIHFGGTDLAGHSSAWDLAPGSGYRQAAKAIDQILDAMLVVIDADPALRGRVAIVLTADHGGGDPPKSHTNIKAAVNFTIPFLVWRGEDSDAADLYLLNPTTRTRPEKTTNPTGSERPPIRNSDAGNLALMLLSLPPIEGSTVNASQDLRVVSEAGTRTP